MTSGRLPTNSYWRQALCAREVVEQAISIYACHAQYSAASLCSRPAPAPHAFSACGCAGARSRTLQLLTRAYRARDAATPRYADCRSRATLHQHAPRPSCSDMPVPLHGVPPAFSARASAVRGGLSPQQRHAASLATSGRGRARDGLRHARAVDAALERDSRFREDGAATGLPLLQQQSSDSVRGATQNIGRALTHRELRWGRRRRALSSASWPALGRDAGSRR